MNWIELKALYQLSVDHETSLNQTLKQSSVIHYLSDSLQVLEKTTKKLIALDGYQVVYDTHYASTFSRHQNFLQKYNLLKPQTRFELQDIDILMNIAAGMESGDLEELRIQIIAADESLRGVSLMFFKNEKYILGKPSLIDALKLLLKVDHFSIEKDQQYIYKLECHNPSAIVLCENLDFLTKPNKPRRFGIELWYAGGKNVQKLHYASSKGIPIYYSGDWDYDGLSIFALVKRILSDIIILTPNAAPRDIVKTEHDSHWKDRDIPDRLSGLASELFSEPQQDLIKLLIRDNSWIIEESNDLTTMLRKAGVVFQEEVVPPTVKNTIAHNKL